MVEHESVDMFRRRKLKQDYQVSIEGRDGAQAAILIVFKGSGLVVRYTRRRRKSTRKVPEPKEVG